MKNDFFLTAIKVLELAISNMLKFVTKKSKIRQLLEFTCFIIHVASDCIGVAYA